MLKSVVEDFKMEECGVLYLCRLLSIVSGLFNMRDISKFPPLSSSVDFSAYFRYFYFLYHGMSHVRTRNPMNVNILLSILSTSVSSGSGFDSDLCQ